MVRVPISGVLVTALVTLAMLYSSQSEIVAQVSEREVTLALGHADIGPRIVNGGWTLQVRQDIDGQSVWRDIDEVEFAIGEPGSLVVPESEQFSFLGPPGTRIWVFPQVQQQGVLWPGWNSQDPSVTNSIDGNINWSLKSAEGTGDFFLFLSGSFGEPELLFGSIQSAPRSVNFELDTHAHGNWAFTEPGIYLLEMEMSATSLSGERLSDSGILRVEVGDTDDPQVLPSPTVEPTTTPTPFNTLAVSTATSTASAPSSPEPDDPEPASKGSATLIVASVGGVLLAGLLVFVAIRMRRRRGGRAT